MSGLTPESSKAGPEYGEVWYASKEDAFAALRKLGYHRYNKWETNAHQDALARRAFEKKAEGYIVDSNNCTDAAMAGPDAAGVPTNRDSRIPNDNYNYNVDTADDSDEIPQY